jgi:hypothetical protein
MAMSAKASRCSSFMACDSTAVTSVRLSSSASTFTSERALASWPSTPFTTPWIRLVWRGSMPISTLILRCFSGDSCLKS